MGGAHTPNLPIKEDESIQDVCGESSGKEGNNNGGFSNRASSLHHPNADGVSRLSLNHPNNEGSTKNLIYIGVKENEDATPNPLTVTSKKTKRSSIISKRSGKAYATPY